MFFIIALYTGIALVLGVLFMWIINLLGMDISYFRCFGIACFAMAAKVLLGMVD